MDNDFLIGNCEQLVVSQFQDTWYKTIFVKKKILRM